MEIQLKSTDATPGGTIEGAASLTLSKDIKGKAVIAELYAEQSETHYNSKGRPENVIVKIYSKKETLDGEKLYPKGGPYSYNFQFVVPQTAQPKVPLQAKPGNLRAAAIIGVEMLETMSNIVPIRWFVRVELVHGILSFPVAYKQEINIMAGSAQQQVDSQQTSQPPAPSGPREEDKPGYAMP